MSAPTRAIAAALNLRKGEGPLFLVLGSYLFLGTATTTLLVAVKNGLFLSVYPASYVPYAMIMAALLTAAASVALSGLAARSRSRDGFARQLLILIGGSLVACWALFRLSQGTAFVIYLWLVTVNTVLLSHGWGYVATCLTGREAKRLMPVIGIGGSTASVVAGVVLAPLVLVLGTENVLLIAAGLVLTSLTLLGRVKEARPDEEERSEPEAGEGVRAFLESSAEGFRSLKHEPLLRVLAAGVVLVMATSTLIDFMFKLAVQNFERDRITAIYGLMAGAIGVASIALQMSTSRVIFPKFGVSAAAMGHAGTLALNAGALALMGGFPLVFLLQVLDDSLRSSIERPAEQVSLLPFPRRVKEPAYTTISGVLRPLSRALTALAAIFLVIWPFSLPVATVVTGVAALAVYTRHRRLYLKALEEALARHSFELVPFSRTPLMVDKEGLKVIDEALVDSDPAVVIFALSLLPRLPAADALPLLLPRLEHPRPEVRSEAALTLGKLDEEDLSPDVRLEVLQRLGAERDASPLSALIETTGKWSGADVEARLVAFLDHANLDVQKAALITLGRRGWEGTRPRLARLLAATLPRERAAGIAAVGELALPEFLPTLAEATHDDALRQAALQALGRIGPPAVPVLAGLATDAELDVGVRRTVVGTIAAIDHDGARIRLHDFLWKAELAPTALRELRRLRQSDRLTPLDRRTLAPLLRRESERALRYALSAAVLQERGAALGPRARWAVGELMTLRDRGIQRTMDLLCLAYDPERIRAVESGLASGDADRQSSALELLEGMLEHEDGARVVRLCETLSEGASVATLTAHVGEADRLLGEPMQALMTDEDWFPRALAIYVVAETDGVGSVAAGLTLEQLKMIPLIEKVMILKGSELFRTFPGEELAGIASLAHETHLNADELLFSQGDEGDAFYVVVDGSIRILRDGRQLALLGPREGFGEMAILDHETRSATAQAGVPTTLLRIDQESFDRLVDRNPAIAKGIYRVLSRRLRATLAQLASK